MADPQAQNTIDPLKTLITSVRGEGGYNDIHVKNLLIDTRKKILNKYLVSMVKDLKEKNTDSDEIIAVLLALDKAVEDDNLSEDEINNFVADSQKQ